MDSLAQDKTEAHPVQLHHHDNILALPPQQLSEGRFLSPPNDEFVELDWLGGHCLLLGYFLVPFPGIMTQS
jgi:hypothetical protein